MKLNCLEISTWSKLCQWWIQMVLSTAIIVARWRVVTWIADGNIHQKLCTRPFMRPRSWSNKCIWSGASSWSATCMGTVGSKMFSYTAATTRSIRSQAESSLLSCQRSVHFLTIAKHGSAATRIKRQLPEFRYLKSFKTVHKSLHSNQPSPAWAKANWRVNT